MFMQVISWEEYLKGEQGTGGRDGNSLCPLALTIGVFDGVHLGHQALIQRICSVPFLPAVITFRQNPLSILRPDAYTGDILTLEQKLQVLEAYGVQLTVLIDFSVKFSTIRGRDFIELLLGCRPVKLIALGRNFRCGQGLDTGADEIQKLARERGVDVWIAPPVMDGGLPVSSSRIRQDIAAGRVAEAERLLGRPIEGI
jgi:FAD synthase